MAIIKAMNDICIHHASEFASEAIKDFLLNMCKGYENVAFVFIGTDANVGDSLAPMAGSLVHKTASAVFCYGNLNCTITARDVPYIAAYIKRAHPLSRVVVIDAAVGKKEDVGSIKILPRSIRPGLGVSKNLPPIGDVSVIGVISERSKCNLAMLGYAKVSNVYAMAKVISDGINGFISSRYLGATRSA